MGSVARSGDSNRRRRFSMLLVASHPLWATMPELQLCGIDDETKSSEKA